MRKIWFEFGQNQKSRGDDHVVAQVSDQMYFQPNSGLLEGPHCNSRLIVVTEDDISNYQNRYDIVLLHNLDSTKSVSMAELNETIKEAAPARKPRRSLPAGTPRYIDV